MLPNITIIINKPNYVVVLLLFGLLIMIPFDFDDTYAKKEILDYRF